MAYQAEPELMSRQSVQQDGFELSFVKHPPQEIQLECSICLQVLSDPCLLDCECGNCFCRKCIEAVQSGHNPCPLCSQPFSIILPNKQLKRAISGLLVYCPLKSKGCPWTDELGKLSDHFNHMPTNNTRLIGCGFVNVKCKFCSSSLPRKNIVEHESSLCPKKPYTCQYCGHSSILDDITENHWPICQGFPVPCPFECGQTPQRKHLEHHVAAKCELALIECQFDFVGCQATPQRKDMHSHINESLVEHMSLLAVKYREKNREIEQLKEENKVLEHNFESRMAQFDLEKCQIAKENQSLKQSIISKMTALKNENTKLKQDFVKLNQKYQNLSSQVQEVQNALKKQCSTTNQSGSDDTPPKQPPPQFATKSSPPQTTSLPIPPSKLPPRSFKMGNFERIKTNKNTWKSPPFYSSQGHKMLLSVCPDGIEGQFMSVYVYIIKGEYDEHIAWPFRGEITVTLVDQISVEHKTNTIAYTDACNNCGDRRLTNSLTGRYGWPAFLSLTKLVPNYLQDNCLKFMVNKIRVN